MIKSHMLWRALDQVPIGQAVLAEWESLIDSDFESSRSLFGSTDKIATHYPTPLPAQIPRRVVEHGADDYVAICDHTGDTVPLRKRDLIIFAIDFRRLAKEIATTFELKPTFDLIDGVPRCWRVGTSDQAGVSGSPVYLLVPVDSTEIRRAIESIRYSGLELGSILVPTRSCVTLAIESLLGVHGAQLVVLEESLVARRSGRWEMRTDTFRVGTRTAGANPNESDIPLGDRAQNILQALLEMEAFDSDRRKTNPEVTLHAFGSSAEPNDQKEVFSDLKDAGLLDVKLGRGGGYWLTTNGKSRAERLSDG